MQTNGIVNLFVKFTEKKEKVHSPFSFIVNLYSSLLETPLSFAAAAAAMHKFFSIYFIGIFCSQIRIFIPL